MVDLPQVPRRRVTTQMPHSRVTAEDVGAPARMLAGALATTAKGLQSLDQAIQARRIAELSVRIEEDLGAALREYATSPEAFRKWAEGYLSATEKRERHPGVKARVVELISMRAARGFNDLADAFQRRAIAEAKDALTARIDQLDDLAEHLAAMGGTDSPEFVDANAELTALWAELKRDPRYGVSDARADLARARSQARFEAAAIVGAAERRHRGGADPVKIAAEAEAALNDPSLALSPAQRRGAIAQIKSSLSGDAAERQRERAVLERAAADDVSSIEATGTPVISDPESVAERLTPAGAAKYRRDRAHAEALYGATRDFGTATPEMIADRLAGLVPQAGEPGFDDAQRLLEAAEKKAEAALKLRRDDPARAARAFPSVAEAESAARPDNPASYELLIRERLAAQSALGVDEMAQSPLTKDEALALARPIDAALPGPDQVAAMRATVERINGTYGRYADGVLAQVLRSRGIDRELATYGAGVMRKLQEGRPPSRADGQAIDRLREAADADAALSDIPRSPAPPDFRQVPNTAQITRLLANPELANDFDAKFGVGAARFYLNLRDLDAARHRDSGATIAPDGSESWSPPAR